MKNIIQLGLVFTLVLFSYYPAFAHDRDQHAKQDTTENSTDPTAHVQEHTHLEASPDTEHEDHHDEAIETIVEAEFSDFPNLHPLMVHFPIVLLILAFFGQLAALFIWKKELSLISGILLLTGFIGAYLVTTVFHPHTGELSEAAQMVLDLHDQYADFTVWVSGIALLLKIVSHFFLQRKWWMETLVVLALAGAVFSVSKAGHYGATLVHLHGVGPQGKYLETDSGHTH